VFTVINPTTIAIVRDGSDGGPAEISVTGTPADLFQEIYLLDAGLVGTTSLQLTQTYRLFPGKRYVEIETTIKNESTGAHPLPFLDPSELDDLLGQSVPNLENLQLSVPMGQFPLLGGEQRVTLAKKDIEVVR